MSRDVVGEEVEVEQVVPDEVVLLAPGVGAVEGEFVVVAFRIAIVMPLGGHGFGGGVVFVGDVSGFAECAGDLA